MSFNADRISSDSSLAKGLSQNISRGLGSSSPVLGILWDILIFIASIVALPVRVFLRKNFGERTIGSLSIALSILWLFSAGDIRRLYLIYFVSEDTFMDYYPSSKLQSAFIFCFILVSLHSLFQNRNRRKKGQMKIYSYYRGDSIFYKTNSKNRFNDLSNTSIWTFSEPIFILVLGLWMNEGLDEVLGFTLIAGAIGLFVEEYRVYQKAKAIELDLIDVELESAFIEGVENELKTRFRNSTSSGKSNFSIAKIPSEKDVQAYFNHYRQIKSDANK